MQQRGRGEFIYLNGKLLSLADARISPLDYGYLYGYAVFETMRSYDGRVFRLNDHLDRLIDSATNIGIKASRTNLAQAVTRTLNKNHLLNAYVRVTLSAGEGAVGLDPSSCRKPTLTVITKEFTGYPAGKYDLGLAAITVASKRTPDSFTSRIKTTSFLDHLLAKAEAVRAGADEAITMNADGTLTEGSVSNLFAVFSNDLHTPKLTEGILPGITRKVTFELANRLGMRVIERRIRLNEIYAADEMFLTNSLIEIMPLTKLNDMAISAGKIGEITKKLREEYSLLVNFESSRR